MALATGALGGALAADDFEFLGDARDAILDAAAVGFQLGFTFTTAHADAAFLAGQVAPETGQAREEVLQLGQFHLELAFASAGAVRKNIENERGAVENFAFKDLLKITGLGGAEFVVENDGIDVLAAAKFGEFLGFAGADEGACDGGIEALHALVNDVGAGGRGEFPEFVHGILEVDDVSVA